MTKRGPTTTTLSTDQADALDKITSWYTALDADIRHCDGGLYSGRYWSSCPPEPHTHGNGQAAPVYAVGGWAGTGKTTILKTLEHELGIEVIYGAPTHKAASVLRKKLPADQAARVRTYHIIVYHMHATYFCELSGNRVRRIVEQCGCGQGEGCRCPARFDPCSPLRAHAECRVREELTPERREYLEGHRDLVVIDETSMLSPGQVEDVRSFGVPVILVGDHGQLPPIKAEMNRWTLNPDVMLTQIHRQGADSGILQAAHDVRRTGWMTQPRYGIGDTVRLPMSDPQMEGVLDRWEHGPHRIMITSTNKLRASLNAAFRERGTVRPGDRVVALGGRVYDAHRVTLDDEDTILSGGTVLQVHNGMTGTVRKVIDHGGPCLDMVVELDDHELATATEPVCLLVSSCARAQFGAQADLPFNSPDRPKGSRLWDYAYALTAHKAQGSEFEQVMVMDELPPNYAQWLYTSITRAKQACLVVNYRK